MTGRAGPMATTLAAVRLATTVYAAGYLLVRSPALLGDVDRPVERFESVGVVTVLLDRPLPSGIAVLVLVAALVAAVPAVLGWRWPISGPVFALLVLWVLTYRHSWGVVLHTENLMVLQLLVLSVSPATARWALDRDRRSSEWLSGWMLRALMTATVLTYLVAGIAKIRNGGWDWVTGDVLRSQVAYDNLRKHLLGDVHSPFGGWLTGTGWIWPPMALAAQVIELGAPLALLGRRLRLAWVTSAWGFHVAIAALMAIVFPYQLLGIAFLAFLPIGEWLAGRSGPPEAEAHAPARGRRSAASSTSSWRRM